MFHHPSLAGVNHRDQPLPQRPWAMSMIWSDVLFLHWRIEPAVMRDLVPAAFELDLFDDAAWLGVVPFRMTGVRPRLFPALPRYGERANPSNFLELNVRTYVRVNGRPGVLFFSLDAESKLAVRGARRFFHLPYYDAQMQCRPQGDWFDYRSRRTHRDSPPAELSVRYRPLADSAPCQSQPGTLEHFLSERYCLYTLDRGGRVLCGDIHHVPWPLQPAEAEIDTLSMTGGLGLPLSGDPFCAHFAKRVDVVAWRNRAAWLNQVV